ncbi:unnamed protein product [Zymoseptoria tritici ST99CH_3D7]|uniref:Uncharacterized protein n=1 Tax=Zymoseptoria tritici (strain ST99CH_3D7) TaxID=1276538 RepID=A0A1X7RE42_ZYMT9|nr:unnamed protein product [Zymoseptoria tritici ST99CH_3D7]
MQVKRGAQNFDDIRVICVYVHSIDAVQQTDVDSLPLYSRLPMVVPMLAIKPVLRRIRNLNQRPRRAAGLRRNTTRSLDTINARHAM